MSIFANPKTYVTIPLPPMPAFRIGGIYRTQGGELRRLTADTREIDGNGVCVQVEHINEISGAASNRGSWRRLADGVYPGADDNASHRAHLVPGELMVYDRDIQGRVVWQYAVVDAEVEKSAVTIQLPAGAIGANFYYGKNADQLLGAVHVDQQQNKLLHCARHGVIYDGNKQELCQMCVEAEKLALADTRKHCAETINDAISKNHMHSAAANSAEPVYLTANDVAGTFKARKPLEYAIPKPFDPFKDFLMGSCDSGAPAPSGRSPFGRFTSPDIAQPGPMTLVEHASAAVRSSEPRNTAPTACASPSAT